MAEQVQPHASPTDSGEAKTTSSPDLGFTTKPTPPEPEKPIQPQRTYVIRVPKDQVYRVPPRENACRFKKYTRRQHQQSRCCCFCWLIGLIFIFIILLGIAAGVLYLVFRPEAPNYTVDRIAISGMNLTSADITAEISPEFDVAVRADNPNDKIGIYYEKDSYVEIYYNDVRLANGALPAFFQPSNNLTVFETALKGTDVILSSTERRALGDEEKKGQVPLKLKLRAPVKIKVGSLKTWKITVTVNCVVTVDKLTAQSKIVSKNCDYSVDIWR